MAERKCIFLNGPPRVGKDAAAKLVMNQLKDCYHFKFAKPLKDAVHAAFGLSIPTNGLESVKDEPQEYLGGLTPRQAYIGLSEDYLKPNYGSDHFGKAAANHLKNSGNTDVVISDCGFLDELEPVIALFKPENCLIIRLHRDGCDFSNDSRSYVYHPDVASADIDNNGTLEDLDKKIAYVINSEFKHLT